MTYNEKADLITLAKASGKTGDDLIIWAYELAEKIWEDKLEEAENDCESARSSGYDEGYKDGYNDGERDASES